MTFMIKDEKPLKEYNKIRHKVINLIKKESDSEIVSNEK